MRRLLIARNDASSTPCHDRVWVGGVSVSRRFHVGFAVARRAAPVYCSCQLSHRPPSPRSTHGAMDRGQRNRLSGSLLKYYPEHRCAESCGSGPLCRRNQLDNFEQ
eukprot:1152802-Prymnesium_polylepis.1